MNQCEAGLRSLVFLMDSVKQKVILYSYVLPMLFSFHAISLLKIFKLLSSYNCNEDTLVGDDQDVHIDEKCFGNLHMACVQTWYSTLYNTCFRYYVVCYLF